MKSRGAALGVRGMVASANTLVSSTGLQILRNGGNAMDAAIAMALTSSVVLPDMCGLGGDAFFLYYDATTKKVFSLNGSGPAGKNYSKEYFKNKKLSKIPETGIDSISIPGAVSVFFEGLKRFGTFSFENCCQDAIFLAEHGYPCSEKTSSYISKKIDLVKADKALSEMLLDKQSLPKKPFDLIYNKPLAHTIKYLSEYGETGFYNHLAPKFVTFLNSRGADFETSDFSDYHCTEEVPLNINYRNKLIYQLAPVSQGIIHLEILNILSQTDISKMERNKAELIHLMVEAKKTAFEDRINYFGDPKFVKNPITELLSSEYGKKAYDAIDPEKSKIVKTNLFDHESSHTTSMVVVDSEGNACSFIHSISDVFGSGVMEPETGVIFNNRLGTGFNLVEGHPNCVAPGKKTMHTLNTYLITDLDNNCLYVGNTPGGDNQPQWNTQTVVNLLDFGLDVQEAIEEPRWFDAQSTNPFSKTVDNILTLESTIQEEAVEQLTEKGHKVLVIDQCGGASQLIQIKGKGHYIGASDPRANGCAIGY